jgi:hypothetical protein
MSTYDAEQIRAFLIANIELWNAKDRGGHTDLYRAAAPNGLIIEYVGQPIGDGWATFNHMWDTYNGLFHVDIGEIFVNGNEGACLYHNVLVADGKSNPTIEIYRFDQGKLHVRYFHHADALS